MSSRNITCSKIENFLGISDNTIIFSQTKVFVRLEVIVYVYEAGVERFVVKVSK